MLTTITGCNPLLTNHSSKYLTHLTICLLTNKDHSLLAPWGGGGGGQIGMYQVSLADPISQDVRDKGIPIIYVNLWKPSKCNSTPAHMHTYTHTSPAHLHTCTHAHAHLMVTHTKKLWSNTIGVAKGTAGVHHSLSSVPLCNDSIGRTPDQQDGRTIIWGFPLHRIGGRGISEEGTVELAHTLEGTVA